MPYDPEMEETITAIHGADKTVTSKRMFGGVCYLYRGHMAYGIYKDHLIVRLGSDHDARKYIAKGTALPFDITGRAMKGWVMIPKSNLTTPSDYKIWLNKGLAFARSLPPK